MDNRTIEEVRENETKLIDEIKQLEWENQKYKEVIDKAMSKLERYADELTSNGNAYAVCIDLLEILKEVEINGFMDKKSK